LWNEGKLTIKFAFLGMDATEFFSRVGRVYHCAFHLGAFDRAWYGDASFPVQRLSLRRAVEWHFGMKSMDVRHIESA